MSHKTLHAVWLLPLSDMHVSFPSVSDALVAHLSYSLSNIDTLGILSFLGNSLVVQWLVHQTTRRPNQSILEEINPEYSLEGLMLKLKLL